MPIQMTAFAPGDYEMFGNAKGFPDGTTPLIGDVSTASLGEGLVVWDANGLTFTFLQEHDKWGSGVVAFQLELDRDTAMEMLECLEPTIDEQTFCLLLALLDSQRRMWAILERHSDENTEEKSAQSDIFAKLLMASPHRSGRAL